jgi:hypothetical protein
MKKIFRFQTEFLSGYFSLCVLDDLGGKKEINRRVRSGRRGENKLLTIFEIKVFIDNHNMTLLLFFQFKCYLINFLESQCL